LAVFAARLELFSSTEDSFHNQRSLSRWQKSGTQPMDSKSLNRRWTSNTFL